MAAILLCLLGLGFLAFSADAQEAYDNLPDSYKKGVDLALEKLDSHASILHHFLFLRTVDKSEFEAGFDVKYIYHNFYLKATKCQKGTTDSTRCKFRNDRPLIDCAICYKTFSGEVEAEPEPYVHCIHRPALTEDMKRARAERWDALRYSSGTPTLLSSATDN